MSSVSYNSVPLPDTYLTSHHNLPLKKSDDTDLLSFSFFNSRGGLSEEDVILMFAYMCRYISVEELLNYLSIDHNRLSYIKTRIATLTKKKYLGSIRLEKDDMFTRTLYYLTAAGHAYISSKMNELDSFYMPYKRKGNSISVMHDYSTGLNYVSLKSCPYAPEVFTYKTEVMLTGTNKANRNSLCCDAYANVNGKNVFIEEDLGTEPNSTLVHKYEKYVLNSYSDEGNILILSCRLPYFSIKDQFPSIAELKSLLLHMRKRLGITLNEVRSEDTDIKEERLSFLKGIVKKYHGKGAIFDYNSMFRFYLDSEKRKNPYRLAEYMEKQSGAARQKRQSLYGAYKTLQESGRETQMYYAFLLSGTSLFVIPTNLLSNHMAEMFPLDSKILGTLLSSVIPSFERSFNGDAKTGSGGIIISEDGNKPGNGSSFNTFNNKSMNSDCPSNSSSEKAQGISGITDEGPRDVHNNGFLKDTGEGGAFYVSPSGNRYSVAAGPSLYNGNTKGCKLRNRCTCSFGDIFFEFYSSDLGAMIRADAFLSETKGLSKGRTHLVLVVDSVADAMFYLSSNNVTVPEDYEIGRESSVSFILKKNIGSAGTLFVLTGVPGKYKVKYVSAAQEKE